MTQYQFTEIEGVQVRYIEQKAEFSIASLENAISEANLSTKLWVCIDEFLDILFKLPHNRASRSILRNLTTHGYQVAPVEQKEKFCSEIFKMVEDSRDSLVNLDTFEHPLADTVTHPNDPNQKLCNLWLTASIIIKAAVGGNEEAQKMANSVLFEYNPLKILPDWGHFVPLKSNVMQVINDLHEGMMSSIDRQMAEKDEK